MKKNLLFKVLFLGVLFFVNASYAQDSDGDGISDVLDLDDDNDGILDTAELRCSELSIANSSSGTGAYQDQFYIFNWTDASFSDGLHNGDSQTFVLADGLTVTATISGISVSDTISAATYVPSDMNTWTGAFAHQLYNTSGSSEALYGEDTHSASFTITFEGTRCGSQERLDIIAIDAESTHDTEEYTRFTTDGGNWTALDTYAGGGTWTGVGTQVLEAVNTEDSGGNTIFFSEDSSVINIEMDAYGRQAVAFGLWLICNSDDDCLPNYKDFDSDNDGCPDAIEGSGTFDINDLVSDPSLNGGSSDVTYYLGTGTDTDSDGLLDIVEPSGQAIGSSQDSGVNNCPIVVDFDGVDDVVKAPNTFNINDWTELTLQFWVKSNQATQTNAGIIGQKGVLEITQNGNLEVQIFNQGVEGVFSNSLWLDDSDTWQHVTLVYNNGLIQLYYNGVKQYEETSSVGSTFTSSANSFNIGGQIKTGASSNYFDGWIDEVRVFDKALTESQIQQMVYQEIQENGTFVQGGVTPKDVKDIITETKVSWSNLELYYKMGASFNGRKTIDYSSNGHDASLYNIYTQQTETAPMPYVTVSNGDWDSSGTWLHGSVWDLPARKVFPNGDSTEVEHAIVKISHDVTTTRTNKILGLLIDADKTLTVAGDNLLENKWYLELNGTLDLEGDSQLIQTDNSDLVTSAIGKILRRQEGTGNAYWYNYWTSPVGEVGVTSLSDNNAATNNIGNTSFNLNLLKDESGFNCSFSSNYTGNESISTYWLYTFVNGLTYWDWAKISPSTPLSPGIGYTQKGTGILTDQQYIFEGKPNNGTILISVTDVGGAGSVPTVSETTYLMGNPYPSALDIHKFIDDNEGVIDGVLQLWQQWSGASHHLDEYNGGYAQVNKLGSARAYQFVGIEGAHNGSLDGTKTPSKYLPVGQGFITEIVADGTVEFNNSQRVFIKESDADGSYDYGSVFFKNSATKTKSKTASVKIEDTNTFKKIRLEMESVSGPSTHRELLLGFSDITSDDYDYGYDAENVDVNNNDIHLDLNGKDMNMQAYGEVSEDKVVALNFKSSGNNIFEIKMSESENFDESEEIYLKDTFTGVYFDLTENTAYSFSSDQGKFNSRFEIVFQSKQEALGIEENKQTENFVYFQNNNRKLYAKKLKTSIKRLTLVNMLGQSVLEFKNVSQNTLSNGLDIPRLATGSYIAYFKFEDNEIFSKKMIIN